MITITSNVIPAVITLGAIFFITIDITCCVNYLLHMELVMIFDVKIFIIFVVVITFGAIIYYIYDSYYI